MNKYDKGAECRKRVPEMGNLWLILQFRAKKIEVLVTDSRYPKYDFQVTKTANNQIYYLVFGFRVKKFAAKDKYYSKQYTQKKEPKSQLHALILCSMFYVMDSYWILLDIFCNHQRKGHLLARCNAHDPSLIDLRDRAHGKQAGIESTIFQYIILYCRYSD